MKWEVKNADVLKVLSEIPDGSIQCVVTSPPYWGLRDYGVVGQLGLERTPEEYLDRMTEVFGEVRRVLRDDGTLWLNIGDSYCAGAPGSRDPERWPKYSRGHLEGHDKRRLGLKTKDMIGIPWRLAFALQADGWYLRSDIIWSKPNPMPESVADRPTKAHEYLFLLAKSERYFYDADAIKEQAVYSPDHAVPDGWDSGPGKHDTIIHSQRVRSSAPRGSFNGKTGEKAFRAIEWTRNKRSVWTISTQAFPDAHFATFPEKLVEPCIRAGTSDRGGCAECGAPMERQVKREMGATRAVDSRHPDGQAQQGNFKSVRSDQGWKSETVGWKETCACSAKKQPQVVLDPFCGSGTTGVVALKLDREFIGIELNPEYVKLARRRIGDVAPLFSEEATTLAPAASRSDA